MPRRVLQVAAACLLTVLLIFGFQQTLFTDSWRQWRRLPAVTEIGSDWIEKGPVAQDKVLVMARMPEDSVDWVTTDLTDWQHAIYHMDDHDYALHPPRNVGREAMAYLTFLIDHYQGLPEIIVFLHPHLSGWPKAWHTDAFGYNNVNSVRELRLDYVRAHGYANMRCIGDPGCPAEIQPFRNDSTRTAETAFSDTYIYFFGGNTSSVPDKVGTPCCSQFAVSRDQVLKRPRSDYIRYRRWLLETKLHSDVSGRVMEYMWHIIFGKPSIWCPSLNECWCEQFGRC